MKSLALALLLSLSQYAYAGSQNCTSPTTQITASGNHNVSLNECILSVEKSFSEYTVLYLPPNPSLNNEFTARDATSYSLDTCDQYECWPAGVQVSSYGDAHLIDGVNDFVMAGYYPVGDPSRMQVKFAFDGSDYVSDYPYSFFHFTFVNNGRKQIIAFPTR